ncbi:MAG: type II toxin-antitoxin system HicA family toxin [Gammaproteobacteria bacterium]
MGKYDKLFHKILTGRSDSNIAFSELILLLQRMGFELRIRGDHHIVTRDDVSEILNLQPMGAMAKPYQVKQVRQVIVKYGIGLIADE